MISKYDIIHKNLQKKIIRGEITYEAAKKVDSIAFMKYGKVEEKSNISDIRLVNKLENILLSNDKNILDDDLRNQIKKFIEKNEDK